MTKEMSGRQRHLWLDPGFGASGDMILGALVGLGAPLDHIIDRLSGLAVDGWEITETEAVRGSLTATRVSVECTETHHHRTWSSIDDLLAASDLPSFVVEGARATFRSLGLAEAAIHGVDIDEVHFHEVGAVDAIVDIAGAWIALDALGVHDVTCGPVGLGHGTVNAAHGVLPLPAPATARLLQGAEIKALDMAAETVTPTGAALLTSMMSQTGGTWGSLPSGTLAASARGAGGRNPDGHANVVSAFLVDRPVAEPLNDLSAAATPTTSVVMRTNLDDVTGEVVAHTIERCLAGGADDAWARPIVMKKGRPAVELSVLCSPERAAELQQVVFSQTGTLGIRQSSVTKFVQPRRFASVLVEGYTIAIKVGPFGAKPEYDDLAKAAEVLDRPLLEVQQLAMAAYLRASLDLEQ